jgi:peptide/nickel transport system substrate-binding protein
MIEPRYNAEKKLLEDFMKKITLLVVIFMITASFLFGGPEQEGGTQEKVLTYPSMPENLDPASQGSGTYPALSLAYENLARYKANSTDLEPWLAKSWDISADGLEITFFLREGVQFHGGYGEFTAEDVKYSIERIVKEELPEKGEWVNLDRVDVVDKYTAKVVLTVPTASLFTTGLPFQAGMIVSKKAVEELGAEAFNLTPVGTGPYRLESWEIGEKMVFVPFEEYWGTKTLNATKVEFLSGVDDAFIAMDAGEVDIVYASAPLQFQNAKISDEVDYAGKEMRYWWISLPFNDPVLSNKAARLAFRYAVDVDALVEVGGYGIFKRANTLVPPALKGHWADAPAYEQDYELARKYLAEAGYPDGFECTVNAEAGDPTIELLQEQLGEVGIKLIIEQVEGGIFWENASTGKYVVVTSYQTLPDTGYALVWFESTQYWNIMKYSNARYDELYKQGQLEVDQEKRAEMHLEMQKLMDEDVAIIPIAFLLNGVIFRKGFIDLGPNEQALLPNGVVDLTRVKILD